MSAGYAYSQDDKSNLDWFEKDFTRRSLTRIKLREGHLRGLFPCDLKFTYPITAIAGRNGSGKSTVLAVAANAFHNTDAGYCPPDRVLPYYRFSDFFFQTDDEISPDGIEIQYGIAYDNWKKSDAVPTGVGVGAQRRWKKKSGKWNSYDKRVTRNVVFFGIDRIVPASERNVFRVNRFQFADLEEAKSVKTVCQIVGQILDISYSSLKHKGHNKYRLPVVKCDHSTYSGFNMGAGEKVLFEILSSIYAAPEGTLFVIDEIELGLHELAQRKFVSVLKGICRSRKIQIICTTHSSTVLDALPPEARIYLEKAQISTTVYHGITSAFATGKLAGRNSGELTIYVEDSFAERWLNAVSPVSIRSRCAVIPIGNATAIAQQLTARYRDPQNDDVVSVLDGDQRSSHESFLSGITKKFPSAEQPAVREWLAARIQYLPGKVAPERYILDGVAALNADKTCALLNCTADELSVAMQEAGALLDAHDIFPKLSASLGIEVATLAHLLTSHLAKSNEDAEFQPVRELIAARFAAAG